MSFMRTLRGLYRRLRGKPSVSDAVGFNRYKQKTAETGIDDIALWGLIIFLVLFLFIPDFFGIVLPSGAGIYVAIGMVFYIVATEIGVTYVTFKKVQSTLLYLWLRMRIPGEDTRSVQIPVRKGCIFEATPMESEGKTVLRYIQRKRLNPLQLIRFKAHQAARKVRQAKAKASAKLQGKPVPPAPPIDQQYVTFVDKEIPGNTLTFLQSHMKPVELHKRFIEKELEEHHSEPKEQKTDMHYFYIHNEEMGINLVLIAPDKFYGGTFTPRTGTIIEYGQESEGPVAYGTVDWVGRGNFVTNNLDMETLDVLWVVDSDWHAVHRQISELVKADIERAAGAVASSQAAKFGSALYEWKQKYQTLLDKYYDRERDFNKEVTRAVNQEQSEFLEGISEGLQPKFMKPWYQQDWVTIILIIVIIGLVVAVLTGAI